MESSKTVMKKLYVNKVDSAKRLNSYLKEGETKRVSFAEMIKDYEADGEIQERV